MTGEHLLSALTKLIETESKKTRRSQVIHYTSAGRSETGGCGAGKGWRFKRSNTRIIIDKAAKVLSDVRGVKAIVLGGSRERGTHSPDSDVDIGIYYDATALDFAALQKAARTVDDGYREDLIAVVG
ncbi:nucleotidyltransferase domain protein [Peptococcaceae bacterium CEB3]|nr:nucleotidyltransferase domain protein [Peptococcaceae bacterium CEB3]